MVHNDDSWKLWGLLAGSMTLGLAAWIASRRRRRPTLRQRLSEEIDLEHALASLRDAAQEVRERLPVHDGRAARTFWQRRLRPLVQQTTRTVPERAQAIVQAERGAVQKLQRELLPSTERAAREAVRSAEQLLEQARQFPHRLAARRPRPTRPPLVSRIQSTLRELAALGFWLVAAGALVYFGLLRPEQRERLRRGAGSLVAQLRELWADFSFSEEPLAEFTE